MRIYTRGATPDLRHGLVSLLLAAFDAAPGEVVLVSPWMRDVELPTAGIGHFSSVFGGHRDRVVLSEFLGRLTGRHRVTLVVKPPAELVPLADVRRLVDVVEARAGLLAEEELRDYDATERAVQALNAQAEALEAAVTIHAATLRMGWALSEAGADLRFLDHVHAKLLWTPAGALLGSANFTQGGFGRNEELMVEVTTPAEHGRLGNTARDIATRATGAHEYDLRAPLRKATVSDANLAAWSERLEAGGRPRAADLLRQLRRFVR